MLPFSARFLWYDWSRLTNKILSWNCKGIKVFEVCVKVVFFFNQDITIFYASESSESCKKVYQGGWNSKTPRVNYLQACQWGVCSDISDKGTAVSVNERQKSVHDTIKDKGTAAVIPLNYLPVRGMHQDRRQRSRLVRVTFLPRRVIKWDETQRSREYYLPVRVMHRNIKQRSHSWGLYDEGFDNFPWLTRDNWGSVNI